MSTMGDVIHDSAALVQAFDELLHTETMRQAPQIARDLGVQKQFEAAIGKAGGVVNIVAAWTGTAWQAATAAGAAAAMFGLLPEVALAAVTAFAEAGTQTSELGLDVGRLRDAAHDMTGAVRQLAGMLHVVEQGAEAALAFIDPPQLRLLQLAFEQVEADLAALLTQDGLATNTQSHAALH